MHGHGDHSDGSWTRTQSQEWLCFDRIVRGPVALLHGHATRVSTQVCERITHVHDEQSVLAWQGEQQEPVAWWESNDLRCRSCIDWSSLGHEHVSILIPLKSDISEECDAVKALSWQQTNDRCLTRPIWSHFRRIQDVKVRPARAAVVAIHEWDDKSGLPWRAQESQLQSQSNERSDHSCNASFSKLRLHIAGAPTRAPT